MENTEEENSHNGKFVIDRLHRMGQNVHVNIFIRELNLGINVYAQI